MNCNIVALLTGSCITVVLGAREPAGRAECRDDCQNNCSSTVITASDIVCRVTYIASSVIPIDDKELEKDEAETGVDVSKTIVSTTKRIKCGKVSGKILKEGESCAKNLCENHGGVKQEYKKRDCILYRQDNLTYPTDKDSKKLDLPMKVMPGMKVTAYGAYRKDRPYSQFSISKDPDDIIAVWKWLHVCPQWKRRELVITEGLHTWKYGGKFPISDWNNFSITFALTHTETKIYTDKVLVRSMEPIPWIQECLLRRYSKIYLLVVRKMDEGCEEMDNDWP